MRSSLPFTSVVSLHTNVFGCGVARFSKQLADRLGVPFFGLRSLDRSAEFPLLSLKASEFVKEGIVRVRSMPDRFGIFWHDAGFPALSAKAAHVFYADPSLGSPGLWCPSLITPRKRPVRLFSFGMAHKLQTDKYKRVRELLDAASIRYHLRVSVGLHEGTSLDGAEKHFDALKEIMGPENVTVLGILSDDAVSEELANADYVLAFFEKGLRANNTTVHAAIVAERTVITNWDALTEDGMRAYTEDINTMPSWPANTFGYYEAYSWDTLILQMEGVCERSKSPIVS